jgi:hypothetical protein
MNTEKEVAMFVATLAEAFPGQVTTTRKDIYLNFLKKELAHVPLKPLIEKLVEACQFFPSIKEILAAAGARKQTRRELATEFIDTMLALMEGSNNIYETAGTDNCNFWKDCTGISAGMAKQDIKSGHLETRFLRGQWIDAAEREYAAYDRAGEQLEASQSVVQLKGEV